MNFSQYNSKKVLVTGHTGFKGSWLSIWLNMIGAEIVGYALEPKTNKDNFVLAGLNKKLKNYYADIRDKDRLFNVIKQEKPEIIFHLAAQPIVLESIKNPFETFETNLMGTVNILEAFRVFESLKLLIVITTDKVYEIDDRFLMYKEDDRLGGKDPYSSSKAAVELIVKSYINSFFIENKDKKIVTVRAGNVIGGGDWSPYRIVPDCIKSLESNEKIIIRNPKSVRPWQFVLEPLGGYLLLGEKILKGEIDGYDSWNFGPENSDIICVEELVKKIIRSFGYGSYQIISNNYSKYEANFLQLDINKAKKKLNWRPVYNINDAIDSTIYWYKNYKNNNVFEICEKQIKEYTIKWNSLIQN